jgi:hypothetical protein
MEYFNNSFVGMHELTPLMQEEKDKKKKNDSI